MGRGPTVTCGACPRRDRFGTCLVRAKFMSAAAKACKFGQLEHHRKVERKRGLKNYHIKNQTAAYKGIYAGRKGA